MPTISSGIAAASKEAFITENKQTISAGSYSEIL